MAQTGKLIGIGLFGLAGALIVAILVIAVGIVGMIFGSGSAQACSTDTTPASSTATGQPDSGSGPPAKFVPIYQAAAAKYKLGTKGPSVLAAIHRAETGFGDSNGSGQVSSAGAQGPMQFLPSTWSSVAVDGNSDGKKDITNVDDAIYTAAHYLRMSGAPKHWYKAVYTYNNKGSYVDDVLSHANQYNIPATGDAATQDGTSDCTPSGGSGDYINPFNPGGKGNGEWQAARTDMGVDWCISQNQPIRAIGDGEVTYSNTSTGWPGGGFIVYRLKGGDHDGDLIFVAEQIKDLAPVGTKVTAGQKIGTAIANGSCATEWGWNSAPDNDLARAYRCYTEGMQTNSGKEMARFFINLGAKPQDDPGPGPDFPTGPPC